MLNQCKEIDRAVLQHALSKTADDDVQAAQYVASCGAWSQEAKFQRGLAHDHKCPHCHAPHQDITHTLWSCPALAETYALDPVLAKVDPRDLPNHLKVGIPSALTAALDTTFWGAQELDLHTSDVQAKRLLGIGNAPAKNAGPTLLAEREFAATFAVQVLGDDRGLQEAWNQRCGCAIPARQLMAHIRGPGNPVMLPHVPACHQLAPEDPNVYTDGTNSQPMWAAFTLGAFGTWWKDRTLEDQPLSPAEDKVVDTLQEAGSLGTFQHMPAAAMSSTRAELAGGIAAACADGPVHIASDNMGFVKRLNQILDDPAAHPHKPWSLLSDGDLWEQMHSIIVSKGAHAIKASWTKGHITEQQVNEGRCTRAAQVGNDLADTMADVGAEGFGMAVQEVARAWAHRQGAYAKLERRILCRLANVMKADATKREELAKTQALLRKDRPQSLQQVAEELPYACSDAATTLDLAAMHQHAIAGVKHPTVLVCAVHSFLKLLRVQPVAAGMPGVSWLELLMLFDMAGGSGHMPSAKLGSKRAPSTKQRLCTFKSITNLVIKTRLLSTKPTFSRRPQLPLIGLCILALVVRWPLCDSFLSWMWPIASRSCRDCLHSGPAPLWPCAHCTAKATCTSSQRVLV